MTEKRKLDEAKDKKESDAWLEQAREVQNIDQFHALFRRLTEDYVHDYGTIVHAITAAALAAARLVDRSPVGGITGFQAGCVMWGFLKHWGQKEGAMRLIEYRDMLYPQNAEKFERQISKETWDDLQAQAAQHLSEEFAANSTVRAHWQSIVDGQVPFGFFVSE